MSWTIDDAIENDVKALKGILKTSNASPVMFCASRDQGRELKDSDTYPFKCLERDDQGLIFRIGAADEYGNPLPKVSSDVDYLLPCDGLDIWNVDDRKTIIEGSSDATALAAGLAALILACEGSVHGRNGIEWMRHPSRMKLILDDMISKNIPGKFIQPTMFEDVMAVMNGTPDQTADPISRRMAEVSRRCEATIIAHGSSKHQKNAALLPRPTVA